MLLTITTQNKTVSGKEMKKGIFLFIMALGLVFGSLVDAAAITIDQSLLQHSSTAKNKTPNKSASHKKWTKNPGLRSASVFVTDPTNGKVLYEKNANAVVPIASITKLMTAMVVLDAKLNMSKKLTITKEDIDTLKKSGSRLKVGTKLSRKNMLRLALMASENRAASALSRYYPGGRKAFVAAMNKKAQQLGLKNTHFKESTGLNWANVSNAHDLARMVAAAHKYKLIRKFTTTATYTLTINHKRETFRNTNKLVRKSNWDISLSKTGYIKEAGRCLVMQAKVAKKPTIIVLLDSQGTMTRIADAKRLRYWIEHAPKKKHNKAG
jgi:serine-type D-Ala-D-Ala endopeptidase (penicillin-binding protein 7)